MKPAGHWTHFNRPQRLRRITRLLTPRSRTSGRVNDFETTGFRI
jgi:hypothetical protein